MHFKIIIFGVKNNILNFIVYRARKERWHVIQVRALVIYLQSYSELCCLSLMTDMIKIVSTYNFATIFKSGFCSCLLEGIDVHDQFYVASCRNTMNHTYLCRFWMSFLCSEQHTVEVCNQKAHHESTSRGAYRNGFNKNLSNPETCCPGKMTPLYSQNNIIYIEEKNLNLDWHFYIIIISPDMTKNKS